MKHFYNCSILALSLAALLTTPLSAHEEPPVPAENAIAAQDKVALLPILASAVAERVFPTLIDWIMEKIRGPKKTEAKEQQAEKPAVPTVAQTESSPVKEVLWGGARAALIHTANFAVANYFAKAAPLTISEDTPIESKINDHQYQGVFVSFVMLDAQGNAIEVRKISDSFKSGEKFKLRLISTFNAIVNVDSLEANKQFQRIYPEDEKMSVFVKAGQEVFLPLGSDEFEFDQTTGMENLVLTARDPRITDESQLPGKINRRETKDGSFYVLDLAQQQLPSLTQIIQISHQ
jgi:hypothetical protein